jgi:hypothetical protein
LVQESEMILPGVKFSAVQQSSSVVHWQDVTIFRLGFACVRYRNYVDFQFVGKSGSNDEEAGNQ